MVIKIIGVRPVSFKGSDGEEVTGKSYHYLYQESGVEGYAADKVFVRSGRSVPFVVNGEYSVYYRKNGKLDLDNIQSV